MPAVGFVDDDDISEFQHAFLDALKLVAGSGQGEEDEGVDHVGDGDLGLPHPDGLHQNHVEAGGLEQHDGFPGGLGNAAECARGRRGPNIGVRVYRQSRHSGLVAQNRAAGARRRRVDRQNRHPVTKPDEVHTERLDGGRLSHSGYAGDADVHGTAGIGHQCQQ